MTTKSTPRHSRVKCEAQPRKHTIKLQLDLLGNVEDVTYIADLVAKSCFIAGYTPCKLKGSEPKPISDYAEADKFIHERLKKFVKRSQTVYGSAIPLYDLKSRDVDRYIDILWNDGGKRISISVREIVKKLSF